MNNGSSAPLAVELDQNESRIFGALRATGLASRAELAELTGLSRTTISKVIDELENRGLIREDTSDSSSRRGRPAALLRLEPAAGIAVGIDFGHERLRIGIADLSFQLLAERYLVLDVDQDAEGALDAASALVDEALKELEFERGNIVGIGVGVPAPLDRTTGGVGSTLILPRWREFDLGDELGKRLGHAVVIENDANLGALGEAAFGAARDLSDFAYVQVSAGIGAGLLLGGRLYRGATGAAGEIGHIQARPDGAMCRCGKRGCLETLATTHALVSLMRETHGEDFDLAQLVDLSKSGDPAATRVITDAGRAVGRVIADLSSNLDLGMVVVGGDLIPAGEPLLQGIRESIQLFAMPGVGQASVTAALLGDRAEMLGALALVISNQDNRVRSFRTRRFV
jgi:predicted NBD/HSP70 family sugar kinase